MGRDRLETALTLARTDVTQPPYSGGARRPIEGERLLAIGDPQAPLERFFEILEAHGALGNDGRLAPGVHLVSMGDHFDWGKREERERAARSGLQTLCWLAAHPADRVTLILGNHDLGRVGELAGFDDAAFRLAQAEADSFYRPGGTSDPAATLRFRERYPDLPTPECAARDLSTFREVQRRWVASLLRSRRFSAAAATPGVVLSHAGVTRSDLDAIGLAAQGHRDPIAVAGALNATLDTAVSVWTEGTPLAVAPLHRPGSAESGEGRGIFHHRPSNVAVEKRHDLFEGPPRRRFDPRDLPPGLTQAIGHIRDGKCRQLFGPWVADGPAKVHGPIRHLRVSGEEVTYRRGLPRAGRANDATLLFLDGGMAMARPDAYELLDLATLAVARREASGVPAGAPA